MKRSTSRLDSLGLSWRSFLLTFCRLMLTITCCAAATNPIRTDYVR